MFFSQGVLQNDVSWVKSKVEYNSKLECLADTKLHQAALTIIDSQGFFIKYPPNELIGSVPRVFTEGLAWLNTNSVLIPEEAIKVSNEKTLSCLKLPDMKSYISYISSNSPFDRPLYTAFLKVILPKGLPSLL
jgi:hypothetical protein